MATHGGILASEIPRTEEPGGLQSMGSQELEMTDCLQKPLPPAAGMLLNPLPEPLPWGLPQFASWEFPALHTLHTYHHTPCTCTTLQCTHTYARLAGGDVKLLEAETVSFTAAPLVS